jgi:DSBA-like thioredoxin domain
MTEVQFFFDPVCPWTWITQRWVVEVAEARGFTIRWETFSLRHHNRDNPAYDPLRDEMDAQYPAVRIIEAVRARHGNAAVGRLYTVLGTVIHHDRDDNLTRLAECIELAGLEPELIKEGDERGWDPAILASTAVVQSLLGAEAGVPTIIVPGSPTVFFGPVLSPAPTGAAALELWDAFVTLGRFDGLYGITRERPYRRTLGPRPV